MSSWAFVVGVNDYPAISAMKPLKGAVADAAAFAEWALHPDGGNVAPENLFFWSCPEPLAPPHRLAAYLAAPTPWPMMAPIFDRPPTSYEVCLGIGLVAKRALEADARRLYVYFAGHGLQTKPKNFEEAPQTCFVAGDYHPDMMAAGLVPCDDMARMLKVQGPPEIVMFLDVCRNDASIRVARPPAPWNVPSDPGHHDRLCVGRAAQEKMVAYEVPHGAPTRGAFSTMLVNGLRTHRVGGRLTLRELESFVVEGLATLVSPHNQHPDFEEKPRPWEMVFAEGPPIDAVPDLVLRVLQDVGEDLILVGGPEDGRLPLPGTAGTRVLPLAPGVYVLETMGGTELRSFVHVGPEATDVAV